MKIGMVLDKNLPDIRVENEIQSLKNIGYDIKLLCLTDKINSKIVKLIRGMVASIPILSYLFYFHISRFIRKENIEVLHLHDLPLASVIRKIKKKFNIKIVLDLHENFPYALASYSFMNTWRRKLVLIKKWLEKEKKWTNQADYIITVIEEAIPRYKRLGAKKIFVVPNYVNIGDFLK